MNFFTKKLLAVLAGVLMSTASLSACSSDTDDHMMHSSETGEAWSAADVMFAQMMIPHHQQAVEMSTLAETRAESDAVKTLAAKIKSEQQPEIDLMTSWLKSANASLEMGHEMHMDGMLSDEDITQLSNASGAAFDELFIKGMIAHHQGAIRMAESVKNSKNAQVSALAAAIIAAQTSEIAELEALLAK